MRRHVSLFGLAVLFLAIGPAAASEVVYFTNGTQMAVMDHTVEEGMVRVKLGQDSTIAFPTDMVDRIVRGGEEVFRASGEISPVRNKRVEGDPTPVVDTRVGGRPLSYQIQGKWVGNQLEGNPHVARDPASGLAVYKPFPFADDARANRKLSGRLDILTNPPNTSVENADQIPVGARPFGRGYVGKMPQDSAIQRPMLSRLMIKSAEPEPSKPEGGE